MLLEAAHLQVAVVHVPFGLVPRGTPRSRPHHRSVVPERESPSDSTNAETDRRSPDRRGALFPADHDADAAEVRAGDHHRGDLRAGPADGRPTPGAGGRGLGRDAARASSGSGRAAGYEERHEAPEAVLRADRRGLGARSTSAGHPIEVGHRFIEECLPGCSQRVQRARAAGRRAVPWLAALVCCLGLRPGRCTTPSAMLHGVPTYETYNAEFMNADLAHYLDAGRRGRTSRSPGSIPADFLSSPRPDALPAWHLVGGKDPLDESELTGDRAGRRLSGPAPRLDPPRRAEVPEGQAPRRRRGLGLRPARSRSARIAVEEGVDWLTADFNCTVREPAYVNDDPRSADARASRASTG